MKFSFKIVSSAIGLALLAGVSVVSAQVTVSANGTVTAVKNPLFGVVQLGNSLPVAVVATSTVAVAPKVATSAPAVVKPAPVLSVVTIVNPTLASASDVAAVNSASCPVVTSFMKVGGANDAKEVAKVQAFLKSEEKLDVDVTGIYDSKTEAAVSAFQKKYMADSMGPWGATRTSGAVYVTTAKKINQLACGAPLMLSKDEVATVTSYKVAAEAAASQQATVASPEVQVVGTDSSADMTSDADNSAAVGQASVMSRFWHFIVSFFQK